MKPKLTVLSHGMGQDSTTIQELLIHDKAFRQEYAPNDLLVIFSETKDEHDETYAHLRATESRLADHGIPFIHVVPELGYHTGKWQGLREFYRATNTVGSKAFPKTCTDKLKLVPIYKCLENWVGQEYNLPTGRKKGFYEFFKKYGKIDVLIGIAAGEDKRIADPTKDPNKWKRDNINIRYPLHDLGIDRSGCHAILNQYNQPIPYPSNCKLCPFMSEQELVYMHRFMPKDFCEWVEIESTKIRVNTHNGDATKALNSKGEVTDNLGVWGKKLLPQVLKGALEKYGHWTDQELIEYKMSHGHCVASKY